MINPEKLELAYIIDDDITTIELVKMNNDRFGFCERLVTFTDPVLANQTINEAIDKGVDVPQMILLDINMPVMDAWDFLDKMNDVLVESGVSVFILSSSINPEDMEKSKQYSSVLKYILKPLSLDKIGTMLGLIQKSGKLNQ
jgi:CheY-like chemotaxis protein